MSVIVFFHREFNFFKLRFRSELKKIKAHILPIHLCGILTYPIWEHKKLPDYWFICFCEKMELHACEQSDLLIPFEFLYSWMLKHLLIPFLFWIVVFVNAKAFHLKFFILNYWKMELSFTHSFLFWAFVFMNAKAFHLKFFILNYWKMELSFHFLLYLFASIFVS
jgi:hypothetical protein